MYFAHRVFILLFSVLIFAGCESDEYGIVPFPENYHQELEAWKADRLESLTNPTGWMRLSGMYWLEEGESRFGSGNDQDLQFPEGTIPHHAGTFTYLDGQVTMKVSDGVAITHNGNPVEEMIIYDSEEDTPHLEHNTLEWLVIERNGLVGIRLYNKENEKVDEFTGFDTYPVSEEWHIKARFIPSAENTTIPVINILGQNVETPSPGMLEFSVDGEIYSLVTLEGSTRMFVILGDATNSTETYQAGRYMYIDYPEEDSDYTVIDFNKAYNPPCAYSTFTTCQLPPPQNRLDLPITAGEKRPVGWTGI
ncbi:MAG: DUF1684 domain-containing protein [Balneolaceae bacterium]